MSAFHEIALAGEANNQPKSTIIIDSFAFTDLEVIYQTRETVSHRYIKTPTRTFKIRHTAEYFWRNSRCLNSRWNIVSNVGCIFSIEVNKEIKSSKSMLNETMYLFCVDELWMRLRKTVHTIQLLRFLDLTVIFLHQLPGISSVANASHRPHRPFDSSFVEGCPYVYVWRDPL